MDKAKTLPELDVWQLDVGPEGDLEELRRVVEETMQAVAKGGGPAGVLIRLRTLMGNLFGWDPPEERSFVLSEVPGRPDLRRWEVANKTVDARLDLTWGKLAVYAQPRGWFGRLYMAAIEPFRRFVIYPTFIRAVERRWKEERCNHSH